MIILEFGDATAKFYCRVYYAEQFQELRSIVCPHGEERCAWPIVIKVLKII